MPSVASEMSAVIQVARTHARLHGSASGESKGATPFSQLLDATAPPDPPPSADPPAAAQGAALAPSGPPAAGPDRAGERSGGQPGERSADAPATTAQGTSTAEPAIPAGDVDPAQEKDPTATNGTGTTAAAGPDGDAADKDKKADDGTKPSPAPPVLSDSPNPIVSIVVTPAANGAPPAPPDASGPDDAVGAVKTASAPASASPALVAAATASADKNGSTADAPAQPPSTPSPQDKTPKGDAVASPATTIEDDAPPNPQGSPAITAPAGTESEKSGTPEVAAPASAPGEPKHRTGVQPASNPTAPTTDPSGQASDPNLPTATPSANANGSPGTPAPSGQEAHAGGHEPAADALKHVADASPAPHDERPAPLLAIQDTGPLTRGPDGVQNVGLPPVTSQGASAPAANSTGDASAMLGLPAVPVAGLPVEIAARFQSSKNRFEIRLDPPELGRVEVRLDVDRDGKVTSRLVVDRQETLDLLRRDAPQLERALQQAGLKTGDSGMQFSLRDQNPGQNQNGQDALPNAARLVIPDEDIVSVDAARGYGRFLGGASGIDIRV